MHILQLLKEKALGVMDTHWLNVDPDPAFQANARIRNRIQEFDDQKLYNFTIEILHFKLKL